MNTMNLLFPLGVRLSTWITIAAFMTLAVWKHDRMPLLALAAWITGYEAVFQIVSLVLWRVPLGWEGPVFFIVLGAVTVAVTHRSGLGADWWLIAVSIILIVVWAATGFHLNGHQHGMFSLHTRIHQLDAWAEVLNEVSKTLWAAAYLVPLLVWNAKSPSTPKGGRAFAGSDLSF